MKKIRWGMIGCGAVAETKNGPGLYLNPNCELRAVTNRTWEKAVSWAARHNGCAVCRTVDELLADPDIDIVYIATTPDAHCELAMRCARAGKHVYIEKPVALRYADAQAVAACCAENGVRAFVAHYRRGLPQFVRARALIAGGGIGTPLTARILSCTRADDLTGWRADAAVAGGGHFFEADVHALDVLDFLLGPYTDARLTAAPFPEHGEIERTVAGLFTWGGGVTGSGLWCFDTDAPRDEIEVFGTEGSLRLSSADLSAPLLYSRGGRQEALRFEMPRWIGMPHEALVADVLLTGEDPGCVCTLERAMRTLRLTCRARELLNGGGIASL